MFSYLQTRHGHYHFRLRTPADLRGIIPQTEIVKSLKTSDLQTARVSVLPYLQGIRQTVSFLRSRVITPEQAQESLHRLLNWKPRVSLHCQPIETQKDSGEAVSLSKAMNMFIADKMKEWTAKTKMETEGVFKIILDLTGDVPVDSIDREKVRSFKLQLMKLPPNTYKTYRTLTPLEVIKQIDSGKLKADPMSITSVNKHLSRLYSLLSFCMKEGHRTDNPAEGMNIKQKRRQDEERKAYDRKDIQRIIKNLPRDQQKPERFWIPMICMLSGMRLDEACQLYTEDIRQVDGVWCFDVNDSKDKKLKNLSSRRTVPMHPRLIDLGLLEHVKRCPEGGRLWGNLTWCKVNGYSNLFGKWFQRFNRQHITEDPLKTFHSLRHSFANTLKQLRVEGSVISELMGHSNGSITTGRYGKRYQPRVLLEVISQLDYQTDTSPVQW